MPYTSTFGSIVSRDLVEQAVLGVLQTPPSGSTYPLIAYYIAELERQLGLQPQTLPLPPGPSSYRGGLDFDTFEQEWAPVIMCVANPSGIAERKHEGFYGSWYEIRVAALVTEQDEDTARQLADRYGAAVMACLAQNGGLGTRTDFVTGTAVPFAEKTIVDTVAETTFPNPRMRRLAQSTVTLRSFIDQIVTEPGPTSFPANPYTLPAPWPTITTVTTQLQAENASGTFSTATGVTVNDPVQGGGNINITE